MTITTTAINLELSPALKDYAEKRLQAISKYDSFTSIDIELSKTTNHHRNGEIYAASVTATSSLGKIYHATSEKVDIYEAVDDVRDDIVREIRSTKGRDHSLFKRGAKRIKDMLRGLRN
ncbi:ribosome-associated translation inhibitor RaiA [Patescibacteria group bacterium]|nr:ribosome-associated translation inhibitor RaiA [Patescibacteria group bacterium]